MAMLSLQFAFIVVHSNIIIIIMIIIIIINWSKLCDLVAEFRLLYCNKYSFGLLSVDFARLYEASVAIHVIPECLCVIDLSPTSVCHG